MQRHYLLDTSVCHVNLGSPMPVSMLYFTVKSFSYDSPAIYIASVSIATGSNNMRRYIPIRNYNDPSCENHKIVTTIFTCLHSYSKHVVLHIFCCHEIINDITVISTLQLEPTIIRFNPIHTFTAFFSKFHSNITNLIAFTLSQT